MVGLDEGDVEFHLQNNCTVPLVVGRCVMTPHSTDEVMKCFIQLLFTRLNL